VKGEGGLSAFYEAINFENILQVFSLTKNNKLVYRHLYYLGALHFKVREFTGSVSCSFSLTAWQLLSGC
jgi:hypothetical protein